MAKMEKIRKERSEMFLPPLTVEQFFLEDRAN
ncbi:hypothetical protein Calab_2265 [Caldithrix abyssi DSM 13497]|uniref:Uncharacterized protein n=1 Tax=Caldithrix abyssi DSM 13497 TaxID=880073 RepID=H1XWN7_CALAY|nr:hypothetical protein Calab_2265 [Caldithrix abyssi DSM 13497]